MRTVMVCPYHNGHKLVSYRLCTVARPLGGWGPVALFQATLSLRLCLSLLCGRRIMRELLNRRLKQYKILSYAALTSKLDGSSASITNV